ncbi:HAMP domain-containing histidine kinase [Tessaracoccus sp. HDW20]|uniref:sensor histidine kinase n=1 Tax=Tessaracoccus coleopterorum TaxID=2714950 RepID=UPI0018D2BDA0|nr:HAMP domain-containing sensor histidine kinase [Tessaracoccus coleopterorum]NHB85268.1 HAMP domain-containing histidine kinase [Tessaracoccus coleopterorum]
MFAPDASGQLRSILLVSENEEPGIPTTVTTAESEKIYATPADGEIHTIRLPEMGSYRVMAYQTQFGKAVVGIPVQKVENSLTWMTRLAVGLTALALVVTAVVTRAVLRRATRKLSELTVTADEVSRLELERGTVEVPRVDVVDLPEHNEVTRLSSAFNQMLDRVEGALASREASETKLRRFVADASHELRNPLAAIRGYAELARRSPEVTDARFAMGRIESESTRMSKLVNDLLLLARLDSDARIEPGPVDAVEVVLNAVSDAQAASSDHRWLLDVPTSEVTVLADADQLHQVMVNLLSNARTHTPPGTQVHTSVRAVDGLAVIEVADDGPGIPEETLPLVFERFTKADEARAATTAPSTGLGLAIVRAMVESWGGRADVASRPGLTTFRVSLPLADGVAAAG